MCLLGIIGIIIVLIKPITQYFVFVRFYWLLVVLALTYSQLVVQHDSFRFCVCIIGKSIFALMNYLGSLAAPQPRLGDDLVSVF